MRYEYVIRTIYIAAPYPDHSSGRDHVLDARIHIGNDEDPTKNPYCPLRISDSGVYRCSLKGRYTGIVRTCTNSQPLGLTEFMAYASFIVPGIPSAQPLSSDKPNTVGVSPW
jgi:hypothetical protein